MNMTFKKILSVLAIGLMLALFGCGNKGPLYLPEEVAETLYLTPAAPSK